MSDTFERKEGDGEGTSPGGGEAEPIGDAVVDEDAAAKEQALLEADRSSLEDFGRGSSLFEDAIAPSSLDEFGIKPDELLGAEALAPSLDGRLDPLGLGVENSVGGLPGGFGSEHLPGLDLDMNLPGGVGQATPGVTGAHQADPTIAAGGGVYDLLSPHISPGQTAVNLSATVYDATIGKTLVGEVIRHEVRDAVGSAVTAAGEVISDLGASVAATGAGITPNHPVSAHTDAAQPAASAAKATAPAQKAAAPTAEEQAAAEKAAAEKAAAEAAAADKAAADKAAADKAAAEKAAADAEDAEETTTNPDADSGPMFTVPEAVANAELRGGFAKTPTTGGDAGGDVTTDTEGDLIFIRGGDGGFTDPMEEQVDVALFQPEVEVDFNHAGPEFGPGDDGVNPAGSSDFDS